MIVDNVVHMRAVEKVQKQSESGFISPEHLHEILPPARTKIVTFRNQKAMESYRRMIYAINKQGDFRYRTMRDDLSMYGLVLFRLI
jgi:hypothetical protein